MIKGILFDKDGTLIHFDKLWIKMVNELVADLMTEVGRESDQSLKIDMLASVGVTNQSVDGKGPLAGGTSLDVAEAFQPFLSMEIPRLHEWIKNKQSTFVADHLDLIEAAGDITGLIASLKEKDIIIGVVTADDSETTKLCLQKLGITDDIQFVAAADRYEAKPSPESFQVFCDTFDLQPEEVVMVGDTVVDLQFAKNSHAGYGIGVLSGTGSESELAPLADILISKIDDLVDEKSQFVWQRSINGKRGVDNGIDHM